MNDIIEKLFPKAIEALKKTQQPSTEERIAALESAVADLTLQNQKDAENV